MGQYADLFDDGSKPAATFALRFGVEVNPDEAARVQQLSRRYGIPAGAIAEFKPDYEIKAKVDDGIQYLDKSPKLRDWLAQDPVRAEISHDDLGPLSSISEAVKYLVSAPGASRGGLASDVSSVAHIPAKVGRAIASGAPAMSAGLWGVIGTFGGFADQITQELDDAAALVTGTKKRQIIGTPGPESWALENQKNAKKLAADVMGADPTAGWAERALMSGFQSAGQNLLTLPIGIAGSANSMLGVMGASVFGESYGKGREKGLNPLASATYAAQDATAEIVFERYLGQAGFMNLVKSGASAGKLLAYEVIKEIPGEIGTTLWQNFNEWANLNPEKSLKEFIYEQPEAIRDTIIATIVGGSTQIGAIKTLEKTLAIANGESSRAESAQQAGEILKTISDLSAASKTRERDTETFQGFLQSATEDTEIERVYVTPAELQAAGISVDAIGQLAPSLVDSQEKIEKLQQDIEMGRDIEIPTAELMTNLPGSGLEQTLVPHLKTEAGGYSQTTATEYMKNHGAEVQAMVEKVMGEKAMDDTFKASADKVEQMVMEQLTSANRFTEDVNKPYAALWKAFFAVQAARLKTTPEQLFAQFNPKIVAEGQGAYDQNGRLITDSENFKRFFGDSKVVDSNGKPLVVYHGTGKEFSVFDYSRIGEQGRAEGAGFYFTNSKDVASGYGKPMEVYLSIKNPLAYDAKPFSKAIIQKIVKRVAELEAKSQGGDIADGFLSNFGDVRSDGANAVIREAANLISADRTALDQLSGIVGSGVNPQYVNEATRDVTGHDGVVSNGFSNSGDASNKIYVAFFPEQIKSATGNNGNFDPNDANILRQDGIKRQFKAIDAEIEQSGGTVVDNLQVDQLIDSSKIPTITLADLVGKKVFPTIADRTAAAALYTGIDSSGIDVAIPLLGGPFFPLRESNADADIVWANRGKSVTSQKAAKLKDGANYMMIVMGDANMHQSNTTVSNAFFATLEAYVRDKRITKKNAEALNKLVRGSKNADARVGEYMKQFPGFDSVEKLDEYLHRISFEARSRLLELLGSKGAQELGAPSMSKILEATREPSLAGHRWGDGVLVVEVDQESPMVNLGENGTQPHPDFPLGIKGKVVGKLAAPVNYEILWQDWISNWEAAKLEAFDFTVTDEMLGKSWSEKLATLSHALSDGKISEQAAAMLEEELKSKQKDEAKKKSATTPAEFDAKRTEPGARDDYESKMNARRAFELAKPIVEITQDLVERIGDIQQNNIEGARQARLAADMATGNWRTSDLPVNQGGVSPQEFIDAINNSAAKETLTPYTLDEVKAGIKAKTMKIYQLGADGQIFFMLKTLEDGRKVLTSVVNNEQGARGIGGAAAVLKALEDGATDLDCYAVTSDKYPAGFLPSLYEQFGFKVNDDGVTPFNEKFFRAEQKLTPKEKARALADAVKYWRESTPGFDPANGMPALVEMQWSGSDEQRAGITQSYLRSGSESFLSGGASANARSSWSEFVRNDRAPTAEGGATSDAGRAAGDQGAGNGTPVASRVQRTVAGIANLSDAELRNLGLTQEDRAKVRKALGLTESNGVLNQDSVYNQSNWYFSALTSAITSLQTKASTAQGWKDAIKGMVNKGQVKADELEWTGINDWLDLQEGKVSKDSVLEYLAGNGVQVEEVTLGGEPNNMPEWGMLNDEREDAPKYSQYTLPGGENYREVLLTLPVKTREVKTEIPRAKKLPTIAEIGGKFIVLDEFGEDMLESPYASMEKAREAVEKWAAPITKTELVEDPAYQSSHWDQPNILAHIRLNDRTDAEGNKVLFVEEIQSDWGQDGKKKGFNGSKATESDVRSIMRDLFGEAGNGEVDLLGWQTIADALNDPNNAGDFVNDAGWPQDAADKFMAEAKRRGVGGVLTAPFVTKTEGWLNLALKRVITMAVEQGYDKVAFVNGEQSADRYDLSKQIKYIQWNVGYNGGRLITLEDKDGKEIGLSADPDGSVYDSSIPGAEGQKLESVVGKEIAEKIMASNNGDLRGLDLKVGGEGMKTFYDKIVPNAVNAMLKKVGGGKLESVNLDRSGGYRIEDSGRDFIVYNPQGDVERRVASRGTAEQIVQELGGGSVQPGFTITDAMREKVAGGLPLFQNQNQEPRGSFEPATMTTTLLKAADLSTFLHESGHFFLEVMTKLADQSPEIRQDLDTFFKWSGVESLDAWNAMSLDEKREHHENFARGFEAYLFTGKSPSVELQGMFQRFRAWLLNVYREIKNLNIRLTPEITGVFDRMLATAEQIQLAEDVRAYDAMYSTKPPGMSDEDWLVYQTQANDATQEAIDRLQARSLADMKWLSNAKGKMLRKLQAEAKARRDEVQAEVTEEVMALPVEQARAWIRENAKMTDEDKEALKDWQGRRDAAEERLKDEVKAELLAKPEAQGLKGLEKGQYVSRNRREMANEVERRLLVWEKENQKPARTAPDVDLDVVAQIIPGFTSGDHLAQVMAESPPAKELIDAMTDHRMLERYGDLNSQQAIERAAEEAIHNEARMRFVATEANALRKAVGQPGLMAKAVRDFAAQMIARSRIRDLNPSNYTSAEKRAGIAAKKAMDSGDLQAAAVQKRNQMINAYAAKAALEAREEMIKIVTYLQRFNKDSAYKTIDPDYVDQIHQLLERFDLRPSTSLRTVDKRIALSQWLQQQEEEGLVPDVPQELIDQSQLISYKNVTVEELRGLRDTVKQIAHLGKLKNLLLTAKGTREYEAVRDLIVESINENAGGKTADNRTRPNTLDATIKLFKGYVLSHRKMASLAREIDGFKDAGPMWEYFIRTMNEAGDNEITLRAEATRKLAKIMAPLLNSGKMGGKGKHFPSINRSMNREEIISMALNMGNEGNIQRLLGGEGWSMEQIKPVLATLSKSDWEVVQKVWDFFEDYRPMIAAKERRVYGKEPQWIEAVPLQVVTSDGENVNLRGGYYPIKYDTAMNERAETLSEAEVAKQQLKGAFTSSTTRRSFTKNRAEEVAGRPLLYSFDGIFNGANEIIHDLSWHEWLIDANKLLRSKAIDNAIRNQYGADVVHQFKRAIQDIAAGESPAHDVMDKGLARLRTGAMVAGLGFNLVNSFINTIGLTQSMVRIGPKWVAQGIAKYAASPIDSTRMVREKSQFMASRAQTLNREVTEIQSLIRGKTKARAVMDRIVFLPLEVTQAVVDTPTWIGAYEKALDEGHNEDRAVALADQAVLDSQSGGQTKDLALIQRGGQTRKLLTTFYGFFSSTYQLSVETGKQIKFKDPMSVIDGAAKFMLLWIIPSVLNTLLKSAMSGDDDEPEELAKKLAADQISYIMSQMVGIREATGAIQKALGVSEFNVAYGGPAGYRFFQEIDKLGKQLEQGEADLPLFKAADNVLGILFKYPSGQINKTVEGAAALYNGETDNPLALVVGHKKK